MVKFLSLLIFIVLLGFIVILGSQNTELVRINYLIASGEVTVSTLISISVLVGVLLISIPFSLYILKLKMTRSRVSK